MSGTRHLFIGAILVASGLTGCMDAADRGLGPACRSNLAAAERELGVAKANSVGTAFDWARAASLIAAAKTQQQFNEYQNCVLKAKRARRIVSGHK